MSHEIVREAAEAGRPVAVAAVTAVRGSAPRHLGSMMVFRADGSSLGTIGGGKVELEAAAAAAKVLAERRSLGIEVEMAGAEATGASPICGGRVGVTVEFVAPGSREREAFGAAAAALARGEKAVIAARYLGPGESRAGGCALAAYDGSGGLLFGEAGAKDAASPGAAARAAAAEGGFIAEDGGLCYILVAPADRLLILGGGHVGLALARLAAQVDFLVTIGDERPEFAAAARFPEGVETRAGAWADIVAGYPIDSAASIVVATPNHQGDLACVRAVLGRGYRYAGFVGSRRKTKMILDQLEAEGFVPAEVRALRAPIGVDLGAETPAEIAVSILTELVAARRSPAALAAMDEARLARRA